MIRIILALILFCSIAQAQPVNPPPALPITLQNGGTELSNVMTTVATSGTINNQAIATSKLKFTTATVTLTGLVSAAKAQEVLVYNATGSVLTIAHESASSTAANRIACPGSANYSLPTNSGLYFWYDTVSSRWRFTVMGVRVTSPLVISSTGDISMPAASASVSGYLSSTDYATFLDGLVWGTSGNNIYNTNDDSVWIAKYPCSVYSDYATCLANTFCTPVLGNPCSDFNGDETGCNDTGTCSYSDPDCTGAGYFSSCSGYYRADDGTGSKLQVKATEICAGTPATCASLGAGANCTQQVGCTSNANTCPSQPDETECTNAGCGSWVDCTIWNGDQTSCEADGNCSWSDPDCNGAYCPGDNSSCTGTAAACSGLSPCADQDGCTLSITPAGRFQGDNVTTSDGFLQFLKTYAGTPTAGDCDAAGELGRFSINTVSGDLCYCSGAGGWFCIDPTPAGGGGNSVTTTLAFGGTPTDKAQTVVTGQAWVAADSEIVCQVSTPTGMDPDEMYLYDFQVVVSDLVVATGFTVTLYSETEASGDFDVMCIGI